MLQLVPSFALPLSQISKSAQNLNTGTNISKRHVQSLKKNVLTFNNYSVQVNVGGKVIEKQKTLKSDAEAN